jgi:hypothetical protein
MAKPALPGPGPGFFSMFIKIIMTADTLSMIQVFVRYISLVFKSFELEIKVCFFFQVALLAGVLGQGVRVPVMKENNFRHLPALGRSGYLDMDDIGSLVFLIQFSMKGPQETKHHQQGQQQGFSYPGQAEMRHDPIQQSQNSGSVPGQ